MGGAATISLCFVCVQVVAEIDETVRAGCWVGDCFIYTNSVNRLNYYVGGEIVTVSHLDRQAPTHPHSAVNRAPNCFSD